ncbi:hypothetical protein GJ744_001701 [Endocarpon pusillum]|uniref:Peptidase A2 domain-containing protein n=1 Tax=Endocarpon pusillum TaxID=364733 RepID=A0A8H7E101_9EURO|nr:hypothetical protein GJ744_001701 [Endocarpon pusillum]
MATRIRQQNVESSITPLRRGSFWRRILKRLPVRNLSFRTRKKSPVPEFERIIGPTTSDNRTSEPPSPNAPARAGQASQVVQAERTPARMANENITALESSGPVGSVNLEAETWTATMHIIPDRRQRDRTRIRRCLVDTGSDINLVSKKTLDDLQLRYDPNVEDLVYGISGHPLLPIGSIVLTWHMDGQAAVYSQKFSVIPDEIPVAFDVLLGKPWINKAGALRRNSKVLTLTRRLGLHHRHNS